MQPTPSQLRRGAIVVAAVLAPAPALAAGGAAHGLAWGLPFFGLLLSIALFPIFAPRFWHRRMGLITLLWSAALVVPQAVATSVAAAYAAAWHAILIEYLPFVSLLLALFTVGGGILLEGGPWGTPRGNTALLAIGTVLAGVMGTTGIAMVLIHPLLRANAHRTRKVHLVLFFILLCANAGGATSPLGDPPLLIGFLHGVPFGWPLANLLLPLLVAAVPLLLAFWLIDRRLAASDPPPPPMRGLHFRGGANVALLGVVVATVLVLGVWHPGEVTVLGQPIAIERLVAIAIFAAVVPASLALTARAIRQRNMFTWDPMVEVATLFFGIFITISPVLAALEAGPNGALAGLLALVSDPAGRPVPAMYFWLTGIFSAFLDNAPTYYIFFEMAGGDPARLTGEMSTTLRAIALGSVLFGALTYVGNAPNLMVRSIAAHRGVRMPGFFGYMGLASAVLLPVLVLLTALFFI